MALWPLARAGPRCARRRTLTEPHSWVSPATCRDTSMETRVEVYTHDAQTCAHSQRARVACVMCVGTMLSSATLCAGPVCHMSWPDQGHYPHSAGGETESRKGLFVGLDLSSRFQPLSPLSGNM